MKKIITTTILAGVLFLGGVPAYAQTDAELRQTIAELQQQLLVLLQQQLLDINPTVTATTSLVLNPGQVCGFAYAGSEAIIEIQQELQNQGYTITKVDGKIGAETRAAVSAFQSAVSAEKVDGLIGEETRRLLTRSSLACIGDIGVTVAPAEINSVETVIEKNDMCSFGYNGSEAIIEIQQELQNQGYTITKVDGKIGAETRAAVSAFQSVVSAEKVDGLIGEETRIELTRASVNCDSSEPLVNISPEVTTEPTTVIGPVANAPEPTVNEVVNEPTVTSGFIDQVEIVSAVRSTTAGIPDDTAVFTYRLEFDNDNIIYVSTNPEKAFDITLTGSTGSDSAATGIQSIVSSSQKILREDRTSYFRITKGDTMSLRTSIQPGTGSYYANLSRLSYTNENATTVLNPAMINYGFDDALWRSSTVSVLN